MANFITEETGGGDMKKKIVSIILFVIMLIILVIFLSPLVIVILGAFKTYSEIMTDALALPQNFASENFLNVVRDMKYPNAFINTAIVTLIGSVGIVIFGSLAGYMLSRTKTKLSFKLFIFCIFPMMIPFQSYMITLVQIEIGRAHV